MVGQLLIFLLSTGSLSACPEKCFCHSNIVDCRNIGARTFPHKLQPGVETYFLDENQLTRIPINAFEDVKTLTYLGLSRNCLHLQNYTFEPLLNLQALDLSGNQLSELRADLFVNLLNLTWLSLTNNNLKRLSNGIFRSQIKLTYLDLSNTQLVLHAQIFKHLPQLNTLYLNNNKLRALPTTVFSHLPELQVLDLSRNELSSLPAHFFANNHKLTDLRLDLNRLRHLASTLFANQHALQYLTISGNNIRNFSSKLFSNLTKLLHLDLSNNSLTLLPLDFVSNLEKLVLLKLSDNLIIGLNPGTFRHNLKLSYLHLDRNQLSNLPVFEGLQQLEELTLCCNSLVTLPWRFTDNLTGLHCLQLTDNHISELHVPMLHINMTLLLMNNPICLTKPQTNSTQSAKINCTNRQC